MSARLAWCHFGVAAVAAVLGLSAGAETTVWYLQASGNSKYQKYVADDLSYWARTEGGAVGTVYLEHAASKSTGGWLYVDSGVQARHRTPIPMADDGDPAKVGGELTIPFTQGTLYRVNTVLR